MDFMPIYPIPSRWNNAAGGFSNVSAKKEAAAVGCKKPMILTNGKGSQAYRECMANVKAQNDALAAEQAKASSAAAAAAPDMAVKAVEDAKAAAAALAKAQVEAPNKLGPGTIALIALGSLVVIGGTIVLIVKFK